MNRSLVRRGEEAEVDPEAVGVEAAGVQRRDVGRRRLEEREGRAVDRAEVARESEAVVLVLLRALRLECRREACQVGESQM